MVRFQLKDEPVVGMLLSWSWGLETAEQRANQELAGGGTGVHWPDVATDIDDGLHLVWWAQAMPEPSDHNTYNTYKQK